MLTRLLPFMFAVCFACQTGKIDSPKVRDGKIQRNKFKRFRESEATLWAYHDKKHAPNPVAKDYRRFRYFKSAAGKEVSTISVEEWDCPRPGAGKYMPKAVRKNIRNNLVKINSELDTKNDSLRTIAEVVLFQDKPSAAVKSRLRDH